MLGAINNVMPLSSNGKYTYQLVINKENEAIGQGTDDRQHRAEKHADPDNALAVDNGQHALRDVHLDAHLALIPDC
jgi:hypothetical protein